MLLRMSEGLPDELGGSALLAHVAIRASHSRQKSGRSFRVRSLTRQIGLRGASDEISWSSHLLVSRHRGRYRHAKVKALKLRPRCDAGFAAHANGEGHWRAAWAGS